MARQNSHHDSRFNAAGPLASLRTHSLRGNNVWRVQARKKSAVSKHADPMIQMGPQIHSWNWSDVRNRPSALIRECVGRAVGACRIHLHQCPGSIGNLDGFTLDSSLIQRARIAARLNWLVMGGRQNRTTVIAR